MNINLDDIKQNLIVEIRKCIDIIKNEYPDLVNIPDDYDLNKIVHIEKTGTVSLFVTKDKHFYFSTDALDFLNAMKKIPGFGKDKNHKTCNDDNIIINDNTYGTFLKHVFLKGLTLEEYFKEILLHETFHFCGSCGHIAINEGINEFLTRKVAKKYGLVTSSCGYPKEVKIAYELEKIFGEDVISKISFTKDPYRIKEILDAVSPDAMDFFDHVNNMMTSEFYVKYMKHEFPGLTGPLKKIKKYDEIDYKEVYKLIDEYRNKHPELVAKNDIKKDEKQVDRQKDTIKTNYQKQIAYDLKQSVYFSLKKTFVKRTPREVQIAEQIRKKNYLLSQKKLLEEKKKEASYSNRGNISLICLSLIIVVSIVLLIFLIKLI